MHHILFFNLIYFFCLACEQNCCQRNVERGTGFHLLSSHLKYFDIQSSIVWRLPALANETQFESKHCFLVLEKKTHIKMKLPGECIFSDLAKYHVRCLNLTLESNRYPMFFGRLIFSMFISVELELYKSNLFKTKDNRINSIFIYLEKK